MGSLKASFEKIIAKKKAEAEAEKEKIK